MDGVITQINCILGSELRKPSAKLHGHKWDNQTICKSSAQALAAWQLHLCTFFGGKDAFETLASGLYYQPLFSLNVFIVYSTDDVCPLLLLLKIWQWSDFLDNLEWDLARQERVCLF